MSQVNYNGIILYYMCKNRKFFCRFRGCRSYKAATLYTVLL